MGYFFGIFLITCITIISGVENQSSLKRNRRDVFGAQLRTVHDDADVVGGYKFARSRFFRQYPKYFRYDPEKLKEILYNGNPREVISKIISSKNFVNNAGETPASIHSNDTSDHVSGSTIAGTDTEKDSKETTDSNTHSPVTKDHTENISDTSGSVANTDINLSSSTKLEMVSDTELEDSTSAATDSVTNLSSETTQNIASKTEIQDSTTESIESVTNIINTSTEGLASESDLNDTTENTAAETGISDTISPGTTSETNASTEGITENPPQGSTIEGGSSQVPPFVPETSQSDTDSTEEPPQGSTTAGSSSHIPSENTSNIPEMSQSETDSTAAPSSATAFEGSTSEGTESVTNTNTTSEDIVSETDFSVTTLENTAAETGISDTISPETSSETSTTTEEITENPSQSSTVEGGSSQVPSFVPETSQSDTDSTEEPSSHPSKGTEGIISSTTTQQVSSSTESFTDGPPQIPSDSNRIKVAVSVLFVIIAVMALGVLGTYIIRAKRETIQYDELRLLP